MEHRHNFNEVLFSPLMKLNEVKRYSGTYLQEPESLSQHVTDVLMMSYIIGRRLISYGEHIDMGVLMEKGLLHDIDEVFTGDLPRNTKYANERIKFELDNVAREAVEAFSETYPGLDAMVSVWDEAKEGKEGAIVKLVDMLSVVRKASMEVEVYGNKSCLKIIKELPMHLESIRYKTTENGIFDLPESKEFIRSLLNESIEFINEMNKSNSVVSERYNITKNILEVSRER